MPSLLARLKHLCRENPAALDNSFRSDRATGALSDEHPLRAHAQAEGESDPWPKRAWIEAYEAQVADPLAELNSSEEDRAERAKRKEEAAMKQHRLRQDLDVDMFGMPALRAGFLIVAAHAIDRAITSALVRAVNFRVWLIWRALGLAGGVACALVDSGALAPVRAAVAAGLRLAKLPADPSVFAGQTPHLLQALLEGGLRVYACGVAVVFLAWVFSIWGAGGLSAANGAGKKVRRAGDWIANALDALGWMGIGFFVATWLFGAASSVFSSFF